MGERILTPAPGSLRTRPSIKRRITRPSFMIELQEGSPVGEYEIQTQIGEGAMGTVYSAIHPLIGKQVAIKVLKPELCSNQATIDRFLHEAQAANKIGHPNIVDVFMFGELPDGRFYFVMEWLRGEDLKVRLARGALSVPEACDVLDGIARALEAAHAKEIVHRDLKPDNVFLHQVEDGPMQVKLLDFGIAKLVRQSPGAEKTQTGNMLGTPRYISPEQARGIQVDYRSDIYSLGVMAYEMLAGKCPYDGETAMDIVVKHLSEPAPPLAAVAKVPKALASCVMRMLDKDPANRPSLDEIRGVLADPQRRMTPVPGRATGRAMSMRQAPVRPPPRPRWPIFAVAAVAAAGLGVATWKLVGGSDAPRPAAVETPAPAPAPEPVGSAGSAGSAGAATVAGSAADPAAAARTQLHVDIVGATDATIIVDGRERGRAASINVDVEPGEHEVVARVAGQKPRTSKVTVQTGVPASVKIMFPQQPSRAGHGHDKSKQPQTTTSPQNTRKGGDDELLAPKKGH